MDGYLIEALWREAPSIGPLTQVEPVEGAAPSEKTDVRLVYTQESLYMGIKCYDREPHLIVATQMERDAVLDPDDRVEIIFDTFNDKRNAYFFQIGPAGSKGDALITNNGQNFNKPWDGIWEGQARITDEGWEAELGLPFKTLTFDPKSNTWGFNIRRHIRRKNESCRWATPSQDISFFSVADGGEIQGLHGMDQGIGLDMVPFLASSYSRERGAGGRDFDLEPGFDLFFSLTPSLTASLTVNTDFAETEVDERMVNLTRFPLFFPEKRDFFLRDAGIFEFSRSSYQEGSIIPFYSRRIGLDKDGEEVPLLGGVKLTGREGNFNIGVLDVQTERHKDLPSKNLFVSRVSRNIWEQSSIGFILTRGNPTDPGMNSCFGLDFNYRITDFLGDKTFTASTFFLASSTSGEEGGGSAYGFALGYPNDLISASAKVEVIGEDFNPALGYVRRKGIRNASTFFAYKPRLHFFIRQLFFEVEPSLFTDEGNDTESWDIFLAPVNIEFESGDEIEFNVIPQFDRLDDPFEIQEGIIVPEGGYHFTRFQIKGETAEKRPLLLSGRYSWGGFYDGDRRQILISGRFNFGSHFSLGLEYEQNDVDLRAGEFTTHIGRLRANLKFTPELSWNNYFQFDNESDQMGLNSRFRWILSPGRDLYLVFNQGWQKEEDDSFVPLASEFSFKIQFTIRF